MKQEEKLIKMTKEEWEIFKDAILQADYDDGYILNYDENHKIGDNLIPVIYTYETDLDAENLYEYHPEHQIMRTIEGAITYLQFDGDDFKSNWFQNDYLKNEKIWNKLTNQ